MNKEKENKTDKEIDDKIFWENRKNIRNYYNCLSNQDMINYVCDELELREAPKTFQEMIYRTIEVLKKRKNPKTKRFYLPKNFDLEKDYPKDLYEAFGSKPEYAWLKNVKTLEYADKKNREIKRAFDILKKYGIFKFMMFPSVDYKMIKRAPAQRLLDIQYIANNLIPSFEESGNLNTSNAILDEKDRARDGQHSICALIPLKKYFTYTRQPNMSHRDMFNLNYGTKCWVANTAVSSNAEMGKSSYVYLQKLIERYVSSKKTDKYHDDVPNYSRFSKGALYFVSMGKTKLDMNDIDKNKVEITKERFALSVKILDNIGVNHFMKLKENMGSYKDFGVRDDAMSWTLITFETLSLISEHIIGLNKFDMNRLYAIVKWGGKYRAGAKILNVQIVNPKEFIEWTYKYLDVYYKMSVDNTSKQLEEIPIKLSNDVKDSEYSQSKKIINYIITKQSNHILNHLLDDKFPKKFNLDDYEKVESWYADYDNRFNNYTVYSDEDIDEWYLRFYSDINYNN